MTHNRQSSGGTKSFSYVGSNLHRGTSNVVFTLRQWDTVRKILPWPRHYQSTSSTMPYKEISTNRLFCFWQEKSKTVSPWKLITGAHIAPGIDISNSHREATLPSFSKVWDHSKRNLHRSNKNKNQFIHRILVLQKITVVAIMKNLIRCWQTIFKEGQQTTIANLICFLTNFT